MEINSKIYVAGDSGLIGSAMVRLLEEKNFQNVVVRSHSALDLTREEQVEHFFESENPDYVILAAGKVGGILANSRFPADFIETNLKIQTNVLSAARRSNTKRLIYFGSSCMYPIGARQPMGEKDLFNGQLEQTSIAYAVSKIAGVQTCLAFNSQEGEHRFIPVIPNSTYGEYDDLDPESGHVLSSLVRRFHEAKLSGASAVLLWGSGQPRREFISGNDVASACFLLLQSDLSSFDFPINLGTGEDVSIAELAVMIREVVGYRGEIEWDANKPDGVMQKLLDASRIRSLGWEPQVTLDNGIRKFYDWFLKEVQTGS
jgi:GDP-L-fucose synthase